MEQRQAERKMQRGLVLAIRFEPAFAAPRAHAGTELPSTGLRRGGPLIPSPSRPGSPGGEGSRKDLIATAIRGAVARPNKTIFPVGNFHPAISV